MGLFRPTTVDGAIAGLLKAQANLEAVASDRDTRAKDLREQAASLTRRAEGDEQEASRARAVLGKLKAITEE